MSKYRSYSSNYTSSRPQTGHSRPVKITINGADLDGSAPHSTPTRRPAGSGEWGTRREGVQIKELDEGQPCLDCKKCTVGYSPHHWRKNCNNCKCSRESHEVVVEHGARARLGFAAITDSLEPRSLGYSFVPPGLTTARQVEQFFSLVPAVDVPRLGTKGEVARTQRLLKQLPRQDLSLNACKFIEAENKNSYQDFITARNEIALDVGVARLAPPGSTCAGCAKSISLQQACISAPRMGNDLWHPGCFKCVDCDDLLVDLAYCVHDEKIYCERHYAEQLKPRCSSCDEV